MPRKRKKDHTTIIQWLWSRQAARRTEWAIFPKERETDPVAKEAVAELIGSIHLEWMRERRDIGL